ncbi:MAG: hypothetical protein E7G65_00945 [Veillonella sp.]|uniref:hypothetical protein n=1 Tax=Veillonella sp. TaxID=1926307 RepID=UPI00290ACF21|nr:hypothetical protein [Veillonella sp.]MDU3822734.1 hypothetical protein [Veillonella sp.]
MDFSTIIVQFITVLFASVLGPICLNWFKNRNDEEAQRNRIALKLYYQLQTYCFLLAKSIDKHDRALAAIGKNVSEKQNCGTFQWYHSIPDVEVEDKIYFLDKTIVINFLVFVHESSLIKLRIQSLESMDVEKCIQSYCETVYALLKNAMSICDLLSEKYGITSVDKNWLVLIPDKLKVGK